MIDIQMLRMARVRIDYNRIVGSVNVDALEDSTRVLMQGLGRYYEKWPTHDQVDFTVFMPFFEKTVLPRNSSEEDKTVYRNIVKNMNKNYPDEATRNGLLQSISELNLVHTMAEIADKYNNGADVNPVELISAAMDKYKVNVGATTMPDTDDNIDAALDAMDNDEGIKFRLDCINRSMRPLHDGDSIILGARPDQGKTSLLASETTFMAPQLPDDRCVLWLNNEGSRMAIMPRIYQAALNMTMPELYDLKEQGKLYTRYYDAIGGEQKIKVVDIHGWNMGQVEHLIEQLRPGLTIYDMMDNVQGYGDSQRLDLRLEALYGKARIMNVQYGMIGIATSQISSEGANEMYPGQSMLKDSKTGKQGACEAILMLGSVETDAAYVNTRWISAPKNKLRRPRSKQLQSQITFDRDRSLFYDIGDDTHEYERPQT